MSLHRTWASAKQMLSLEHASTAAFSIAAIVCVVCSVVFDKVTYAIAGLTPLIIDIAVNSLRGASGQRDRLDTALRQIEQRGDAAIYDLSHKIELVQQAVGIRLLSGLEDTYDFATRTLLEARDSGGWQKVRLWAPVGAQDISDSKRHWLETLVEELGKSVDTLSAVVGLPADGDIFRRSACPLFTKFANTPGTDVHYIPPDKSGSPPAIPGMGIAIFENRKRDRCRVIFGFAGPYVGHGEQAVSSGFSVDGGPIGSLTIDWFDNRAFKYTNRFVLRGDDPDLPGNEAILADQLRKIRDAYYPGLKLDMQ